MRAIQILSSNLQPKNPNIELQINEHRTKIQENGGKKEEQKKMKKKYTRSSFFRNQHVQ